MSAEADPEEEPKKASKMPLILGVVLALAGGGGGFMAVQMGLIGGSAADEESEEAMEEEIADIPELSPGTFVPLDTIVVNLPNRSGYQVLRFSAQLEVSGEYAAEIEAIKPRLVDVLNSYLRAVDVVDLGDPTALVRLRSQMLRRLQVIAGEGRVQDLLIMEFVLN